MGLPSLLPCPGCARHVRREEEACPFCGREVGSLFRHPQLQWFPAERLVPALLAFASVSAGVTACHGGERPATRLVAAAPSPQMATPTSVAESPAASASASAFAVPVASVAPSAAASALPSASAAQAQPSAYSNLIAPGSRPRAVYGAPGPPMGPNGLPEPGPSGPPKSMVTVRLGVVRVHGATVANAARVAAGMRAGFRLCYQRGLVEDENMAGALIVSLVVGPRGVVVDVDVSQEGQAITPIVEDCIAARAQAAQFDPPEGASSAQIEFTATLKSEPPQSD